MENAKPTAATIRAPVDVDGVGRICFQYSKRNGGREVTKNYRHTPSCVTRRSSVLCVSVRTVQRREGGRVNGMRAMISGEARPMPIVV